MRRNTTVPRRIFLKTFSTVAVGIFTSKSLSGLGQLPSVASYIPPTHQVRRLKSLGSAIWRAKGDRFVNTLLSDGEWVGPGRLDRMLQNDPVEFDHLRRQSRLDFASGRTIIVKGWVLSRSEVACALTLCKYCDGRYGGCE